MTLGHGLLTLGRNDPAKWVTSGILQVPLRVNGELVLRLYRLPALSHVDVSPTCIPRYILSDDRHMIVRGTGPAAAILDTWTGEIDITNDTSPTTEHFGGPPSGPSRCCPQPSARPASPRAPCG